MWCKRGVNRGVKCGVTASGLFRHKNTTRVHDAVRRNEQNKVVYGCNVCEQEFVTRKAVERHHGYARHAFKKINPMDDDAIDASEKATQMSDDKKQDHPSDGHKQHHSSESEKQGTHPSGEEEQEPLSISGESSIPDDYTKPPPSKKIKLRIRKLKKQSTQSDCLQGML